ncbi:dipeptide ABC transporter ATP-binding protein [uncultured Roseibium sp.]|uniref:ABC transporter ATP-binding protein n=1 Tax=uncultured Roseibium sp. TaxID=1936171 RepID=UPI002617B343|nr:dipeptide ABC transporter ATP-binding protein [uncultured Roseibium sp.]
MKHFAQDTILEARNVGRNFTRGGGLFQQKTIVRAVDGVDMAVRRGETLAIVGESGCGKSTLARTLVRLLEPTNGEVLYEGNDIAHLPARDMRKLRKDLQFVFQDPFSSLNPRMTVGAIVEEPLTVHTNGSKAERQKKVVTLLQRVGLRASMADRYPHEFSGGQRQRIGIARALASDPKVIVADEPVSALDVSVQAQVINLLEDLKTEFNLTLILIAHDLAVIRHMSDRVAVMYLGEVVEIGDTETVYGAPRHPYTQALMRSIPVPAPGMRSMKADLPGDIPSPLNPPSGCRFHTRCRHADERCGTQRPVLEAANGTREVACHRWQKIAGTQTRQKQEPSRSAATEKRFSLYRDWSEKKSKNTASSPGTTPTQRKDKNA